jgi:Protein of unknown function (DUF3800)
VGHNLLVLIGHFDESGLDSNSLTFWVAGWVGHMSVWHEFSRSWNQILQRFDVSAFHATDCSNSQREFKGWTPERQKAFMEELILVINSTDILGFGAGVVKADYERIVTPDFLKALGLTPEWWREPYLLAFQSCIIEAVIAGEPLPASEGFSFIFEEQTIFEARAESVFAEMRDVRRWPRGDRLGSVRFTPSAESTPLQAADMLVYELRKRNDHLLDGSGRRTRISLGRLSKRIVRAHWIDERALGRIADEIRSTRGESSGS